MARPKHKIDPLTLKKAESELEKLDHSKLALQLKAIIASAYNPVEQVAKIFQISTRSIFRWIVRFENNGIAGLIDKPKGHFSSKLSEDHLKEIEAWILSGKNAVGKSVHWTLGKLQKEVAKVFKITISTTALWNHLKKMNLVLKRPRPEHTSSDKQLQSQFKKNSQKS